MSYDNQVAILFEPRVVFSVVALNDIKRRWVDDCYTTKWYTGAKCNNIDDKLKENQLKQNATTFYRKM